jgi:hypothetical protein
MLPCVPCVPGCKVPAGTEAGLYPGGAGLPGARAVSGGRACRPCIDEIPLNSAIPNAIRSDIPQSYGGAVPGVICSGGVCCDPLGELPGTL